MARAPSDPSLHCLGTEEKTKPLPRASSDSSLLAIAAETCAPCGPLAAEPGKPRENVDIPGALFSILMGWAMAVGMYCRMAALYNASLLLHGQDMLGPVVMLTGLYPT